MNNKNYYPTCSDISVSELSAKPLTVGKALNLIWFDQNPLDIPHKLGLPLDEYSTYAWWTLSVWKISGSDLEIEEILEVVEQAFDWMGLSDEEEIQALSQRLFTFLTTGFDEKLQIYLPSIDNRLHSII